MSSQMPYVHMREPSDHHLKTVSAIKMVRTDSQAMTLDKFLVTNSLRRESRETMTQVIPVQLMSVKKLIYEFENDFDHDL